MADTENKPAELTGRLAVQPSHMIPGIPPFVFSVPVGWMIDEAPSALAVIRLPQEVNGFWINAILSHDRVARSVDYKQAAQITWAKLKRQAPDVKQTFEKMARFGANVVYLRGSELTSPDTKRPLGQLHAMFFAPVAADDKGKVVDFFQIVCNAPAESIPAYGPGFLEIIGSFRFV